MTRIKNWKHTKSELYTTDFGFLQRVILSIYHHLKAYYVRV